MRFDALGIALLAGSWIFGLSYYQRAVPAIGAAMVAAGCLLLARRDDARPGRGVALWTGLASLPALWLAPWPFKLAPALLAAGALLARPALPSPWPRYLGNAATRGALVLLAQGLALCLYRGLTARSHELPAVLSRLLAAVATTLGLDAAFTGRDIAIFTMRKVHLLGATWELLLDPLTLAFLVGGLASLFWTNRWDWRAMGRIVLVVLGWLPLRAGLLMALLAHRSLLTDYDAELRPMTPFWNPWVLCLTLIGPALACWSLVRPTPPDDDANLAAPRLRPVAWFGAALFATLSALAMTAAVSLDPVGERKPGRVLMDEHHSTWEPTSRPFDTAWYGHDAGYNYACIYDYLSRFYDIARLTNRLDDAVLDACDVLILKVPTSPYAPDEVESVVRFVTRGGGLMLVGEHTDVFLTSTHLNQVARAFDFEFRDDCLFGVDSSFDQLYRPPLIPHPIVRHMPPMDFAVSCSIAPGRSAGRAAILSTGLWELPADYHASNFYPQVEDRAEMRYGAFVQLWTTRCARGRVVAFADSTIFSNFSAFEPGKAELMLGMVEWANRLNGNGDPRWGFALFAALMGLLAFVIMGFGADLRVSVAAALLGWALAAAGIRHYTDRAFPPPTPKRPLVTVAIDRNLCTAPLSKSGFIKASPQGFGIFEQWILKLGYFVTRRGDAGVFSRDLAVFMHPHRTVPDAFRAELVRYVEAGGKALILDSAVNEKSTANSLLHPFGLTIEREPLPDGALEAPTGWPQGVAGTSLRQVRGGTPLLHAQGKPVAAVVRRGKGIVVALGCGARFNDDNMGVTTDIEPSPALRDVFELEFRLVKAIVEDQLPAATP
jgi:hypothetical protein